MTSQATAAAAAARGHARRLKWDGKDFWDGMDHAFVTSSISVDEQSYIWDVLSRHIRNRLLLRKGIRVPTLGCFDVVPERIQAGAEAVTIQRPVFRLARNLAQHLTHGEAYLPGHKELEPLKYAKVAAAAYKSRRKVEACVRGTTSLLSCCVGKGKGAALVLRDLGVLLLRGETAEMRFDYHFLEALAGRDNLEKAVAAAPRLLDAVTSCLAPAAALCPAGNVVVFPEFELELATRPLSRDLLRSLLRIPVPPPVPPPPSPLPARPPFPKDKRVRFRDAARRKMRQKASSGRPRSATPKDSSTQRKSRSGRKKSGSGRKKSGSGRGRGKTASGRGRGRGYGGGGGGAGAENVLPEIPEAKTKTKAKRSRESLLLLLTPVVAVLSATSSEESLLGDPSPPPRPPSPPRQKTIKLGPEKFWPVLE